jgi:hypothetical protein
MKYYIASLAHTLRGHEHIVFWGPEGRGYTPVVGSCIGEYDEAEAARLNDGGVCIAVPLDAVKTLLSAEPYYANEARFYDQRGPVVDNTRKNWDALLAARLATGQDAAVKPKPTVFRGTRRSYALVGAPVSAAATA